jgi:hypothetical protein
MAFYNRRLAHLGRERIRKGIYGMKNNGHFWSPRFSFSPDPSALRLLWDGVKIWIKAEITTALAPSRSSVAEPVMKPVMAEA